MRRDRLDEKGVRYVLGGRRAVVQYGAPLQSFDFEFHLSPGREDLDLFGEGERGVESAVLS
jgi:hypothetical protein